MVITSEWSSTPRLFRSFAFSDHRGRLMEVGEVAVKTPVNVKISTSHANVLRGLHYQAAPAAQAKIIRVCVGKIHDITLNLETGDLYEVTIDAAMDRSLYIPIGYAHGFECLSDTSVVAYLCTNEYSAAAETTLCPYIDHFSTFKWYQSADRILISESDRTAPSYVFKGSSRHYQLVGDDWVPAVIA